MTIKIPKTKAERDELLREAEALRSADGTFKDDAAREAFDARIEAIEAFDKQQAPPAGPTPEELRAAEVARINGITAAVRTAKLPATFGARLVADAVTLDKARELILTELARLDAERETRSPNGTASFGEDTRDKWLRGVGNWLLVRSGLAGLVGQHEKRSAADFDPGEFRGMTLIDIAKDVLTRAGIKVRGFDRMEIAGQAMALRSGNYQTTSDFAVLLENTMHKVLSAAYALQADTWSRFCKVASVSDFRAHNWYRTGSLTVLDDLTEQGEFKSKTIPDGEKASFSVGTKGNVVGITREVIVNDDMGAIMRLTEMLGRSGKLTIEKAVYALLTANSGLGPTQTDSQPLFHSNRSNVGTGAAISMASIDADASVMAAQMDPNGQDYIDLSPTVLLVPRALRGTAIAINGSEYDPDATSKLQKPNIVKGLFSDIVATHRLTATSATRRYLFADPQTAPVFVVSFLEGQQEPKLESQDGWRFNGVEMKARLDVGVNVVDYRGAVTNAGA